MARKRVLVFVLAAAVGSLLFFAWRVGGLRPYALIGGSVAVLLAASYALRGTLPSWAYLIFVDRDGDPSHLSPRVWLPALLAASLGAGLLLWWSASR
jgi:hypothetical protein